MKGTYCAALLALAGIAAGSNASTLNFLVMGDWGGEPKSPYTTKNEVSTAKSMNTAANTLGAKFTLALGDNFYTKGVKSVSDSRFENTFEKCFTGSNLQASAGFKFHLVAGNHDHIGNVQAQVDYSSKSERWNFPSLWYDFTETAPDGATVQFVMIDTPTLAGNSQWNDDDIDPIDGWDLPGPANLTAAQSQLDFVKSTLAASTADFLIVGGHYPVFSIAEHGPTKHLQPDAFPYLRQYKVSAYLCGHEHNVQYIDVGDGIQYHVIGSAHTADSSTRHAGTLKKGQLKYHNAKSLGGGFASVIASKSGMQIKHYDGSGKVVFTAPMVAPRSHGPSPPAPPPSPPAPPPSPPSPTPPSPSPPAPPPSPPSPTPPSPPAPGPASWECHSKHKVSIGTDTDLQKTGSDVSSCEKHCLATDSCKAVLWHKTDKHCHIFTGTFSHDQFISALKSDGDRDSCFLTSAKDNVIV